MFTRVTRLLFVTHHKQIPFPPIVCIRVFIYIYLFVYTPRSFILLFSLFIYAFSTFRKEFY